MFTEWPECYSYYIILISGTVTLHYDKKNAVKWESTREELNLKHVCVDKQMWFEMIQQLTYVWKIFSKI